MTKHDINSFSKKFQEKGHRVLWGTLLYNFNLATTTKIRLGNI